MLTAWVTWSNIVYPGGPVSLEWGPCAAVGKSVYVIALPPNHFAGVPKL